ncbi:hypothetical protein Gura_3954 [Geotalea uraniireducens Rf4]|uniref:Uncharacterized protein n=1 Tax=Geotalea uraniireducens (strain Rf4) TaxID=351605 RepID=A5G8I2_GEOUR|nr:hypothetical protein Gura_3954 [Geotalea uraniireducens Rf4]
MVRLVSVLAGAGSAFATITGFSGAFSSFKTGSLQEANSTFIASALSSCTAAAPIILNSLQPVRQPINRTSKSKHFMAHLLDFVNRYLFHYEMHAIAKTGITG